MFKKNILLHRVEPGLDPGLGRGLRRAAACRACTGRRRAVPTEAAPAEAAAPADAAAPAEVMLPAQRLT